jgi:hypothetical protein
VIRQLDSPLMTPNWAKRPSFPNWVTTLKDYYRQALTS